ncbi:substrate-binding periplasmic protein [Chrysiogenes arsenatis]|uniref:substrate-binding periplasmic protein n=1 Tax=Chrysiogenes arsenatis TaxID=309797 RepID=UPI000402A8E8|nr:ABC transporter substrate-binding protein [Chrysiogenes arsenatis]
MKKSRPLLLHLLLLCVLFGFHPALAAGNEAKSRLDIIKETKQLRVCFWPDYYGISFFDRRTQTLNGIDTDMAREFSKDLGATVEFVESSFATLIDDLLQSRCDIAMFGIGITSARAQHLRFTSPHMASDIYAITTASNRRIQTWNDIDQPGRIVAVSKGTLHEPVMRDKLRHAELAVYDSPRAREVEVEAGRADVFMTDFPYTRQMLAFSDWARLITPPERFHVTPYGWAIAPGDDPWYERTERFMQQVKRDGRLQAAARRYGLEPILVLE